MCQIQPLFRCAFDSSLFIFDQIPKMGFQKEKKLVRELFEKLESSNANNVENILGNFVSDDFVFKGTSVTRQSVTKPGLRSSPWRPGPNTFMIALIFRIRAVWWRKRCPSTRSLRKLLDPGSPSSKKSSKKRRYLHCWTKSENVSTERGPSR